MKAFMAAPLWLSMFPAAMLGQDGPSGKRRVRGQDRRG